MSTLPGEREQCRCSAEGGSSRLDHDLDRVPFGHRPVAVGHLVEGYHPVENAPGFDSAFEDVW